MEGIEVNRYNKTANIQQYRKSYNEKNKDMLYEKKICDICGSTYCYANKTYHIRTKKHQHALWQKEHEKLLKIADDYNKLLDEHNNLKNKLKDILNST